MGLMANVEKVSVALTPEMVAVVRQAVASGEYASSSEVLREWHRRRASQSQEAEALRRLWEAGLSSGPGRHGDMKALKAEARRRLAVAQDTGPSGA
jgi:antitoxin ParD1/3/4